MIKFGLLFLISSTSLMSALPPVWQGVAEIKAIVDDPTLKDYLESGDVLQGITKIENGWLIQTDRHKVQVEVKTEKQTMPGPQKFSLQFSPLLISNE